MSAENCLKAKVYFQKYIHCCKEFPINLYFGFTCLEQAPNYSFPSHNKNAFKKILIVISKLDTYVEVCQ